MTKKEEFNKEFEELKGEKIENIILYIHMPTGETEVIVNSNIEDKVKYINGAYTDDLIHKGCKEIYITEYIFCEEIKEFDFGYAVTLLKEGKKVARKGWNGRGMFIYYVPDNTYPAITDIAKKEFGEKVSYNPYLAIRNVNGTVSPWVPSINDCLAEDWEVVE